MSVIVVEECCEVIPAFLLEYRADMNRCFISVSSFHYIQTVGLLARGSAHIRAANIHASSGIRKHDPYVSAS
jgi:hypothetical protein